MGRNTRVSFTVYTRSVKGGNTMQNWLEKEVQQQQLSTEQVEGGDDTNTHGLTRIRR